MYGVNFNKGILLWTTLPSGPLSHIPQTVDFCQYKSVLPVLELYVSRMIQHEFLCLLSLSIVFYRRIHFTLYINTLLFCFCWVVIYCMTTVQSVYAFSYWWEFMFPVSGMPKLLQIFAYKSFCRHRFYFLLGTYIGHRESVHNFVRNCSTFPVS